MQTEQIYVKNLKNGDTILSSTGTKLSVSKIEQTSNRVIIIFNGDLEIDFKPYDKVPVICRESVKKN